MQVQVLLPLPRDEAFDYLAPDEVKAGQVVEVPFGNRSLHGVVLRESSQNIPAKLKLIKRLVETPIFKKEFLYYLDWVADYCMAPRGSVLNMAISVPAAMKPRTARQKEKKPGVFDTANESAPLLSPVQKQAATALVKDVSTAHYRTTLLEGVTGSGKTEVYFEAIRKALMEGGQALVLLPEIVLTAQLMERFTKRFGFMPTAWHSHLSPVERRENWRAIAGGEARLVVGARSAVFLPFPSLKVIVVDEEHEAAFKQEDGVIYHGRDMAVARGFIEHFPVILASATPSLETLQNVETGKFAHFHLPERHGSAKLPAITIVDMRQQKLEAQHWLSTPLKTAMAENLAKGEQTLLYLNRRGYAPLTLCRTCGHRLRCPFCSAWMVEHRYPAHLQCHHCGHSSNLLEACPSCHEKDTLIACGPGVERLEQEVRESFPDARLALMTSDNLDEPKQAAQLVSDIVAGKVDIIIGTQMVAKGHHFPKLTLVGVVDADLGLEGGDLRAAERSYQLLYQVSGRAGREELPGRAMIQTFMPQHGMIQALSDGDREKFLAAELAGRKRADMPPFTRLAALIISGKSEQEVKSAALTLAQTAPLAKNVKILGPAPAPLLLLRGRYRYRLLIKAARDVQLQKYLKLWLNSQTPNPAVKIKIDIDPFSFV